MRLLARLSTVASAFVIAAPVSSARPVPTAYEIDASFDPNGATFKARSTVKFAPRTFVDTFAFDLHSELQVTRVKAGGADLQCKQDIVFYPDNYSMTANEVTCPARGIDLESGVEITYEGMINRSIARGMSEYYRGDSTGLYMRGWPSVLWMPIFLTNGMSFPSAPSTHVLLRAPKDFTSIMAGTYLRHSIEGDQAVDEWRADGLTYYDLQYAAHRYKRLDTPGLTVFSFDDTASLQAGRAIAGFARGVVQRYHQLYRDHPSGGETTYIEELPKFGDIASGNVFGVQEERWRLFDLNSKSAVTLAHELVHPFVQMPTPTGDPLYALSIEGAPSYFMIPVVAELRGGRDYDDRLDDVQRKYLERRKPGAKDDDGPLPPEKPLFAMNASDVGIYKDRFVLADRALLFWDYMRRAMGTTAFDAWIRDITNARRMTAADFYRSISRHAPKLIADAHLWLETSDYPQRFRRRVPEP
jgi:hypothetical protein